MVNVLSGGFNNLSKIDHAKLITEIFNNVGGDKKKFKSSVKDYMISLSLYTQEEIEIDSVKK